MQIIIDSPHTHKIIDMKMSEKISSCFRRHNNYVKFYGKAIN